MKDPLLDSNGKLESNDSIFLNDDYRGIRSIFLLVSQVLFFVLGAGFYSFPMWLNFILPDHVSLSRSELTFLGAVPFIGLLGISGMLVLGVNALKFDKATEFLIMNGISAVCVVLSWVILYVLVLHTPADKNNQNISLIALVLLLTGNAVGVIFTTWLGKLFPLIQPKYSFVFSACCNMSFAVGSILSLSVKLVMSVEVWMTLMTVAEIVTVCLAILFTHVFSRQILIQSGEAQVTDVSTKRLIIELLSWKRQYDSDTLATKDCEVRSSQFYLMLLCFTTSCALATTFMANLGPLLSANSDTSDNFRAEVIVLIWASVGQTVARLIIPYVARQIDYYYSRSFTGQLTRRDLDVIQLKLRNRTTLTFTFFIGMVFFVFLLALRLSSTIPFILASSMVSGAYGSMWVINNTFPLFFPGYNFGVLLSFFQFFGMFGMLVCVLVISVMDMNNDSVFVLLLVVAIVTMVVTGVTMVDRSITEPKVRE